MDCVLENELERYDPRLSVSKRLLEFEQVSGF